MAKSAQIAELVMACEFCTIDVTKALVGTSLVHESEYHEIIKGTFAFQIWEFKKTLIAAWAPFATPLSRAYPRAARVVKWWLR